MTDESSHEPALPKDKGGRPKAETIALVLVPHQFDAAGRRGHLFQLCEIALRRLAGMFIICSLILHMR